MTLSHLRRLGVAAAFCVLGGTASVEASVVTIRAVQVCNNDGTSCASATTYESYADKIWAQAGIDFVFLPTVQWNSTSINTYDYDADDGVSLLTQGSALFGDPFLTGILNMYFVSDLLTGGTLYGFGCGAAIFAASCGNQAGVVINSTAVDSYSANGRIDTVAHEVGHVLGLVHVPGVGENLMAPGDDRTIPATLADITSDGITGLSLLTAEQIATAQASEFVASVPEPSSIALIGIAIAGIGAVRRRRSTASAS